MKDARDYRREVGHDHRYAHHAVSPGVVAPPSHAARVELLHVELHLPHDIVVLEQHIGYRADDGWVAHEPHVDELVYGPKDLPWLDEDPRQGRVERTTPETKGGRTKAHQSIGRSHVHGDVGGDHGWGYPGDSDQVGEYTIGHRKELDKVGDHLVEDDLHGGSDGETDKGEGRALGVVRATTLEMLSSIAAQLPTLAVNDEK